jgi:CheY-like chemotaxis protein
MVRFSVRDTGIGIPPDKIDRLFLSFSQVDASVTRKYGGTGLGLAISKRLTGMLGGTMQVESQPGKGSIFSFTIVAQAPPGLTEKAAASATLAKPLRLWIGDDNPHAIAALSRLLRRLGCEVLAAGLPGDLLNLVAPGTIPDALFLDADLKEMQQGGLAHELRRHLGGAPIPVVVMSSIVNRAAGATPSELAPAITISKPPRLAEVAGVLARLLEPKTPGPVAKPAANRIDDRLAGRLPLRILLTDDNVINQKVALRLLRQMGYTADLAGTGREAVEAVKQQPYDVVFMDVQMPEMDGIEASRRIREFERAQSGRKPALIIAMTANAMLGDREKCLAAGMDDYLAKPVRPEALQSTLLRCTSGRAPAAIEPPASPSHPVPDRPPVDMERFREFSGFDAAAMCELGSLYLEQTGQQIARLRAAEFG